MKGRAINSARSERSDIELGLERPKLLRAAAQCQSGVNVSDVCGPNLGSHGTQVSRPWDPLFKPTTLCLSTNTSLETCL
jgi:hypothetical protein